MLLFDVPRPLDPLWVGHVARGVADALAELHAGERAHGSVDERHVAVEDGVVGLCQPATPPDGASAEGDVRALGALTARLLTATDSPPPELVDIAVRCAPDDGSPPPTAAFVAALLALRVPSAPPPGRHPPPPRLAPRRAAVRVSHWLRRAAATVPVLALVLAAAWLASSLRARTARPVEHAPPVEGEGILSTDTGTFALGEPGDVTLVGDWFCRGSPVPALLRPSTGEVFVFERWPAPGDEVRGLRAGAFPGALELASVERAPPAACPSLGAVRNGAPEPVDIPSPVTEAPS